jgi:hypothetical protein
MNELTFYGIAVNRTRSFAQLLKRLEEADYRVKIDLDKTYGFTFPNAPARISRPLKVEMALLRFDRSLNPLSDAEKFAEAHACRLADLWETIELAVTHQELFRIGVHLPMIVLGEPICFTARDIRVPIFPNLGKNGLPPLVLETRANFIGDVHFPVARL